MAFLTSEIAISQLVQKEIIKTETLIKERTVKLNGGFRSAFGGESRMTIPITLPKNTVEWYYSVTTIPDNSATESLNLAIQIAAAVTTTTSTAGKAAAFIGLDKAIVDALKVPIGTVPIDVHILDASSAANFTSKKDDRVSSMNSAERVTQAVVRLNSPLTKSGIWYIGLKNLSSSKSVLIKIEVVAITAEKKWVTE